MAKTKKAVPVQAAPDLAAMIAAAVAQALAAQVPVVKAEVVQTTKPAAKVAKTTTLADVARAQAKAGAWVNMEQGEALHATLSDGCKIILARGRSGTYAVMAA